MHLRKLLLPLAVSALFTLPAFAAIRGVVIDTDGAPIAGAKIAIFAGESSAARMTRWLSDKPERPPIATTAADSKGAFSIDAKPESVVDLTVSAAGYESDSSLATADDDHGTIPLRKVPSMPAKLRAGGKPATGTLVIAGDGFYSETISRSADGSYAASEDDELTLLRAGAATTTISFFEAQKKKFVLDLDAGVRVDGMVVKKDNTPAANVAITIDGWPAATSGADGRFVIEHAPTRWKEVRAVGGSSWGRATYSRKPLSIHLGAPARLKVTVANAATGRPMPFARISSWGREVRHESFVADAAGSIDVPLPPGTFTISAAFPRFTGAGAQALLQVGEPTTITILMQPESTIAGVVLDEERHPVAGAAVCTTADSRRFATDPSVFTAADGTFLLRKVVPSTQITVRASRKGLPPAKSTMLRLGVGERKSGVVITMPRGFNVAGVVRTADGTPLADTQVFFFPADDSLRYLATMLMERSKNDRQTITSGADGTFHTQLAEGRYAAYFRHEGYATTTLRTMTVSAKTPPVEAKMDEAVELSGHVLRANGAPVVGATVSGSSSTEQLDGGTTAADGSFTISGVAAGPLAVNVYKFDEMVQESRSVTAPQHDLLIQLAAGGKVSGRMIDGSTKEPITDFSIGVSTTRSMGGRLVHEQPRMQNVHDDDGRFVLEDVPVMTLDIVGSAPGYVLKRILSVKIEEGKPITDLEVALESGTTLVGKVTGPDGSAIARASIYEDIQANAVYDMMRAQAFTDGNGEFRIPALEPSDRTFRISKEGYASERKVVKVSGKETRLDVRLTSGIGVSGSVVSATGAPVAEAEVSAQSPVEGWQGAGSVSDSQGNFRLEGLKPGRYQFYARKSGMADGTLTDVTVDGSATPVVIRMAAAGTIVGHVTGLKPAELTFTTVLQSGGSGFGGARATVDTNGAFRLEGVHVGPIDVFAQLGQPGHYRTSERKHVEVTAGSEIEVDVDFPEGLIIRGRVTRNGQPLPNAFVSFGGINMKTPSQGTETTDAAGAYEVRGLSPGMHMVSVNDPNRKVQYRTTYEVSSSTTFDIDATGRTLRGRVVDAETDAPLANAVVALMPKSSSNSYNSNDSITDAAGTFAFESVSDGDYTVRATHDGYGHTVLPVNVPSGSGSDLSLKLTKSAGLTARIVDIRDGRSLTGSVTAWDLNNQLVARGTQTSNDTYLLSVAPGDYYVAAFLYGYAPQAVRVTAPNPAELRLPISLGGTLTIESSGKEAQLVRLVRADGFTFRSNEYMGDGTIVVAGTKQIEHVTAGTYTLQLLGPRLQVVKTYPVTVPEGAEAKVSM